MLSFLDLPEEQCLHRLRLIHQVVADVRSLLQEELLPAGTGGHALPVAVKVTTALNFFASGSYQGAIGGLSRVSRSAAHKCIRQVMDGLFGRMSTNVNFPCNDNNQNERAVRFAFLVGFPQVQGAIDCTHVAIRAPPEQPGVSVNHKGFCSINVQLVCNHKKKFMQVCAKFPGSRHNAFILRKSNIPNLFLPGNRHKLGLQLKNSELKSLELQALAADAGDKGHPLQTCLMINVRNPNNEAQERYNESHMTTRCVIKQAIGILKMRFRCLARSGGALQYSPARVSRMIVVCCVLHNMVQQRELVMEDDQSAHQSSSDEENIEEEEEVDEDNEQYEDGVEEARGAEWPILYVLTEEFASPGNFGSTQNQ
ncbi:putative nuclease HARBI1 [Heptranchias perlo]|uniref:putative nuclease HARBI1 n=1 Tax=Heptranchias perlo TaxID=212740 RepID=UPI00355A644E